MWRDVMDIRDFYGTSLGHQSQRGDHVLRSAAAPCGQPRHDASDKVQVAGVVAIVAAVARVLELQADRLAALLHVLGAQVLRPQVRWVALPVAWKS